MEIEVLTSEAPESEEQRPCLGAEYDRPLLEPIPEALPLDREESREDAKLQEPKAKPKRSARQKAVRFEAQDPVGERSSSSAPAEAKVKAKSRAKAAREPPTEEEEAVSEKQPKEPEPVKEPEPSGRGRPLGARNKPKPPTIVERVVEKTVYEKPSPLSAQDLQALLKETLRKQELDAREQKRAYYSQLIRRNR